MAVEFDTSKCLFDPSKFGGKKRIQDIYPETSAYEEFTGSFEDEIKIAILLSDFNSPFIKITEYKPKVTSIFDYLKLDRKDKKYEILFNHLVTFNELRIFSICALYIQIQNNDDFAYWWNLSQLFYSLMSEMGRPRDKETSVINDVNMKLKIQKQADEIKNTLRECTIDLFGSTEMKMAAARAKLNQTRTYAEMYAVENSVE